MNPSQKRLTTSELETIAQWADRHLAEKINRGEIINNPTSWLAWRTKQLEADALQRPEVRRQLARYADAWGIGRVNAGAYAPPIEDVPHPVATLEQVQRWSNLQRVLWRLPAEHWLKEHALARLMEPRRPDVGRTEEDEIRADREALEVLDELEALIAQNHDELVTTLQPAKPILRSIP